MKEFKNKIDAWISIFHCLINLENEIIEKSKENKFDDRLSHSKLLDKSHIFSNEKISSPIFVKLFIKFFIKAL